MNFIKSNFGIIIIIIFLFFIILYLEIEKRKNLNKNKNKKNESMEYDKDVLDGLKERFKYDLVGHWYSCQGTVDSIMNEEWIFYPDGAGKYISRSIMSDEDIQEFKWRRDNLYTIEINFADFWKKTYYDFCKVPTDVGFQIALVEIDEEKNVRKGFGLFEVPLSYVGAPL